MTRAGKTISAVAALVMLVLVLPAPAVAQFGLLRDVTRGARDTSSDSDSKCQTDSGKKGKNMLGSVLGGIAGRTASRAGISSYVPIAQFSDTLSEAIACRLDPQEQEQAATATTQAVEQAERSGGTGEAIAWESGTRANVSGTSTVDSSTALADGSKCMMVTDVVIVEGEETRVQKRMCRGPGQPRYVLQA